MEPNAEEPKQKAGESSPCSVGRRGDQDFGAAYIEAYGEMELRENREYYAAHRRAEDEQAKSNLRSNFGRGWRRVWRRWQAQRRRHPPPQADYPWGKKMLAASCWITPSGIVGVSRGAYATYARRAMVKLPAEEDLPPSEVFRPLTPDQRRACMARGVRAAVLNLLSLSDDEGVVEPHLCAVRRLGWVCARPLGFWAWRFSEKTLCLIRNAQEFWHAQGHLGPENGVSVYQLADRYEFRLTVNELRDSGLTAKALRNLPGRRMGTVITKRWLSREEWSAASEARRESTVAPSDERAELLQPPQGSRDIGQTAGTRLWLIDIAGLTESVRDTHEETWGRAKALSSWRGRINYESLHASIEAPENWSGAPPRRLVKVLTAHFRPRVIWFFPWPPGSAPQLVVI